MEAGALGDLLEKVKAVAGGPQGDLLRKFVDVLHKQEGERERRRPAEKMGRQPGGGMARSRAYR